ncbi:DUF3592 domain-containing protein [Xanthocytophaga agilis]|uniref:Uncharacterized protein n=1 Tax=Xanthocytophaga agilis TaxID=3048010 RepID=A0AAE3R8Q7_9BACT|nr:DUF3592 domain-containing protein [Xanthocytophaga agilis]MDJ1503464.1 hypothetical protein [Xanthocytophaga agilis]
MEFNTRRKIWLGSVIATLYLFWSGISIGTYNQYPGFLSFTGAALTALFLALFIGDFTSVYDFTEDIPKGSPKGLAPLAIIPGIILIFVFWVHFDDRKDAVLEKEGVIVTANIVDGESTTTTRRFQSNTTYEVRVSYQPPKNRKYYFSQSINGSEFNSLYKGATIDVVYWKQDPSVSKALLSEDEIKKAFKIEDRKLEFQDIDKIFTAHMKQETILSHLNKIGYKWETQEGIFVNERHKIALKIDEESQSMVYLEKLSIGHLNGSSFESSLRNAEDGFKKSARLVGEEERISYESDHYIIFKEHKRTKPENSYSTSGTFRFPEEIFMYTIVRKNP